MKEELTKALASLLSNLAALIKLKTIGTLWVLYVFSKLALRGDIVPDSVMLIVTTVVAFYYGTQHDKK